MGDGAARSGGAGGALLLEHTAGGAAGVAGAPAADVDKAARGERKVTFGSLAGLKHLALTDACGGCGAGAPVEGEELRLALKGPNSGVARDVEAARKKKPTALVVPARGTPVGASAASAGTTEAAAAALAEAVRHRSPNSGVPGDPTARTCGPRFDAARTGRTW